ncbi:hypothetical protein AVEN_161989-1 [Araneus ventricosus]|uniref:Uncharacterized protein n=1 Tax=Araneus ventricosus TaxID=182803 RepID=A0A4Y2NW24_ARAVE|nr:hypothetical protein AVEN_99144-1 [Araneus ventricosus]GBN43561.1 hypothetical protein AVEN_15918-1 [Araneus ventricosus]GBN44780.1 hypothetical protein AVEN_25086-1 [Araneus ventricosus]GBN44788.1 hypothetical protein AVEN_161989-1 [Araneus ventricosus]
MFCSSICALCKQFNYNSNACECSTVGQVYKCAVLSIRSTGGNNLPFTMSPLLIELSKVLASDKKALNHFNMSRTAASYKMRLGLAKIFMDETAENLRSSKFSLNIDEATSNNFKRVLSVLVSYFSPIQNEVIIEHLASVIRVTSESLFKEIVKVFQDHNVPWDNLTSILMDLCNVMRGSKSGLEARIREKTAHLLDKW